MAVKLITDTSIQADIRAARASGKRVEIRDKNTSGLVLRITPKGTATWSFVYWGKDAEGKLTLVRLWLGAHGTEAGMSIAEARKAARIASEQRDNGQDPAALREREERAKAEAAQQAQAAEAALAQRMTVQELIADYVRECIPKPLNQYRVRTALMNSIGADFGQKAFVDLTEDDVLAVYHDIRKFGRRRKRKGEPASGERKGSKTNAKHVFDYARSMLNWAEDEKLAPDYRSPLRGKKVKRVSFPRDRVLTVEEIRAFWNRLGETAIPEGDRIALRLQLLLGQRIGEILAMRKAEIDREEKVWRIPASRAKNGKAHVVPLPPMARKLIYERMLQVEWQHLFPNSAGSTRTSQNLGNVLQWAQPVFGFKSTDGKAAPFTTHDLRRTMNSRLRDLGVPEDVRSAALNQSGRKTVNEAHYTHVDLSADVREALTMWDAALDVIVKGGNPFATAEKTIDAIEARARAKIMGGA